MASRRRGSETARRLKSRRVEASRVFRIDITPGPGLPPNRTGADPRRTNQSRPASNRSFPRPPPYRTEPSLPPPPPLRFRFPYASLTPPPVGILLTRSTTFSTWYRDSRRRFRSRLESTRRRTPRLRVLAGRRRRPWRRRRRTPPSPPPTAIASPLGENRTRFASPASAKDATFARDVSLEFESTEDDAWRGGPTRDTSRRRTRTRRRSPGGGNRRRRRRRRVLETSRRTRRDVEVDDSNPAVPGRRLRFPASAGPTRERFDRTNTWRTRPRPRRTRARTRRRRRRRRGGSPRRPGRPSPRPTSRTSRRPTPSPRTVRPRDERHVVHLAAVALERSERDDGGRPGPGWRRRRTFGSVFVRRLRVFAVDEFRESE